MSSNKKTDIEILENLPVESIKWLKQPYHLTFVKGELNLTQLHIYVELVDSLQSRINTVLKKEGNQFIFNSADFDEDGNIQIVIPIANISQNSYDYADIERAANELYKLNDYMEYTDSDGNIRCETSHIFLKVDCPKSQGGRRTGEIIFTINRSCMKNVFDLTRYVMFIKEISKSFKSAYSGRMYLCIEAYKGLGKWTVKYDDLRKIFGCTIWDESEKKWIEKKHQQYSNFKSYILETAKKEMKALAAIQKIDCYFDYTVKKRNGSKLTEEGPDTITFNIQSTSFGQEQEVTLQQKKQYYEYEEILRNVYGIKTTGVRKFMKLANDNNIELLIKKLVYYQRHVLGDDCNLDDITKNLYNELKKCIKESKEEVTSNDFSQQITTSPVVTPSISSPTLAPLPCAIVPLSQNKFIVQNECTDPIIWLVKAKNLKYDEFQINNLIAGLTFLLDSWDYPFDRSLLGIIMKEYYAVCGKELLFPQTIFKFIQEWVKRNKAQISPNIPKVTKPSPSSLKQYADFVTLIKKEDPHFASIFMSDSMYLESDQVTNEARIITVSLPNSFVAEKWQIMFTNYYSLFMQVFGSEALLRFTLRE